MERTEIRGPRRVIPGFRGACHRARIRATRWLHPGRRDLPVGPFGVESFFSDFPKNICCHLTKSNLELSHPVPQRGVSGSSETRDGMRWTRQRQACDASAGRIALRERLAACKTTALLADGEVVWS